MDSNKSVFRRLEETLPSPCRAAGKAISPRLYAKSRENIPEPPHLFLDLFFFFSLSFFGKASEWAAECALFTHSFPHPSLHACQLRSARKRRERCAVLAFRYVMRSLHRRRHQSNVSKDLRSVGKLFPHLFFFLLSSEEGCFTGAIQLPLAFSRPQIPETLRFFCSCFSYVPFFTEAVVTQ